ncbi:galectin-8-like isoform X2 [Photinus pyralis]|nr:galectin-8-like isoform X2 [Photinus pyralis]
MSTLTIDQDPHDKPCCNCFGKRARYKSEKSLNGHSAIVCEKLEFPMPVAYAEDLPNALAKGSTIVVSGFIHPDCSRFAINLTSPNKSGDVDIPLHFNPRLDRHYIVRNSRKRGRWDEEETASAVKSNLERNKNFEVVVFVATEEFLISVNGVHFCGFSFRFPLNTCKRLEIEGLVDVSRVSFKNWSSYPEDNPERIPRIEFAKQDEEAVTSQILALPYTGNLPEGFEEGWQLEISGRIKLLPHSFYINLQDGAQLWPHPIIFLHLNPRFNTSAGENVFIRNARYGDQWGPEERTRMFPFTPGSPFTIAIRRGFDRLSIWVDGQLSGEFKIEGQLTGINTVYIQGDIVLYEIFMHKKYVEFNK